MKHKAQSSNAIIFKIRKNFYPQTTQNVGICLGLSSLSVNTISEREGERWGVKWREGGGERERGE